MDLSDLPQFIITRIEHGTGPDTRIFGHLSDIRGVRQSRGFLYRADAASLCGDLDPVPHAAHQPTVFLTPDGDPPPHVFVGQALPWLDGYWNPYHIAMVLALGSRWVRRVFARGSAHFFELNGVRGWQPAGGALPDGAHDLGVVAGAWDHEHCEICNQRIGVDGDAEGYQDSDGYWLCPACYTQYAARHDISFALEA